MKTTTQPNRAAPASKTRAPRDARIVTLEMVAEAAQVSAATVSRILNGTAVVSSDKKQAVDDAIARLGFVPNPVARGLAGGRTLSIGVVTQSIDSPFYGVALRGVEEELERAQHVPLFVSGQWNAREEARCIDVLRSRRVDGIIVLTGRLSDAWQTLTFDFANAAAGTPLLNTATTYSKATIFFDFGRVGTGKSYYFDDITFVTGTGNNLVLVTFDEKNFDNTQSQPSILSGFGGAENSTLVGTSDGLPADGSKTGKSAKVVKNAGETYAGTSVQRKANDAVPTIPFATGATKMSVRVYNAYPGMRVHLKVEQSGRPDFNSEVDAFTTLTNTWETLSFDFGPAGKHFVPSGPGPDGYVTDPASPAYRPTAQLDVTKTFNKVSIFFDYGLGDAGYDAMPGTRTYYFDDIRFVGP